MLCAVFAVSPAFPPPPPSARWEHHASTNCWRDTGEVAPYCVGANCTEFDVSGADAVATCKAHCVSIDSCSAIVMGGGRCWPRWSIDVGSCNPQAEWDLWVRVRPPPPPAPPSSPAPLTPASLNDCRYSTGCARLSQTSAWAPAAVAVYLAGDVNDWDKSSAIPLNRSSNDHELWVYAGPPLPYGSRFKLLVEDATGERLWRIPPMCLELQGVNNDCVFVDTTSFAYESPLQVGPAQVVYEAHVATFTEQGTFDGVIGKLDYLRDLGVNVLELMPVTADALNGWGYAPRHLYAVRSDLGGLAGLNRLCREAARRNIAVVVDVVLNHLDASTYLFQWDATAPVTSNLPILACPTNTTEFPESACAFGSYFYQDSHLGATPLGPRPNYAAAGRVALQRNRTGGRSVQCLLRVHTSRVSPPKSESAGAFV